VCFIFFPASYCWGGRATIDAGQNCLCLPSKNNWTPLDCLLGLLRIFELRYRQWSSRRNQWELVSRRCDFDPLCFLQTS
jgi:hypothetical protein